jgi:hypothetical protein
MRDVLDLDEAKAARARIVVVDEPELESETVPLPEGWGEWRMANRCPMSPPPCGALAKATERRARDRCEHRCRSLSLPRRLRRSFRRGPRCSATDPLRVSLGVARDALREEIPEDMAALGLERREAMPVRIEQPSNLSREAWRIADEFGWAKTYDAEYVALAKMKECRLVTVDGRLRRGADRLGFVVTPAEL